MNNKGAISIGGFVMLFVGAIVALTLLIASAQNVGQIQDKTHVINQSLSMPVALNTPVSLTGEAVESFNLTNASGTLIPSNNYTTTNRVVVNGNLVARVTLTSVPFNGSTIRANYLSTPDTYADEAGTRSMGQIIILLSVLAILAFVIYYVYENWEDMS
jgi:hypothetical protein